MVAKVGNELDREASGWDAIGKRSGLHPVGVWRA